MKHLGSPTRRLRRVAEALRNSTRIGKSIHATDFHADFDHQFYAYRVTGNQVKGTYSTAC